MPSPPSAPDAVVAAFITEHAILAWAGLVSLGLTLALVFVKKSAGFGHDAWETATSAYFAVMDFNQKRRLTRIVFDQQLEEVRGRLAGTDKNAETHTLAQSVPARAPAVAPKPAATSPQIPVAAKAPAVAKALAPANAAPPAMVPPVAGKAASPPPPA